MIKDHSWCDKGTGYSLTIVDSLVPSMHHDLSDLGLLILAQIMSKKYATPWNSENFQLKYWVGTMWLRNSHKQWQKLAGHFDFIQC